MDKDFDLFHNYNNICQKVKKRLFKKPNHSEAIDQLSTLSKILKDQHCPEYSGFCSLAKARCENASGNTLGEAEALLEAARSFILAEKINFEARLVPMMENVSEAVHCFNEAVKIHCRNGDGPLATLISIELANGLFELDLIDEASDHYFRASDIQRTYNVVDSVRSGVAAIYCKILTGDEIAAFNSCGRFLALLREMKSQDGSCRDGIIGLEENLIITRTLLAFLVQQASSSLRQECTLILDSLDGAAGEQLFSHVRPEALHLLRAVLVLTREQDLDLLREMEVSLQETLGAHHVYLYNRLLSRLSTADPPTRTQLS